VRIRMAPAAIAIDRFGEYAPAAAPDTISSLKAKASRLQKRVTVLEAEVTALRTQKGLTAEGNAESKHGDREREKSREREREKAAAKAKELGEELEQLRRTLSEETAARRRAEEQVKQQTAKGNFAASTQLHALSEELKQEREKRQAAEKEFDRVWGDATRITELESALDTERMSKGSVVAREKRLLQELAKTKDLASTHAHHERELRDGRAALALDADRAVVEHRLLQSELHLSEAGMGQAQVAAAALAEKAEELLGQLISDEMATRKEAGNAVPMHTKARPPRQALAPAVPPRIAELASAKPNHAEGLLRASAEPSRAETRAQRAISAAHATISRTAASYAPNSAAGVAAVARMKGPT